MNDKTNTLAEMSDTELAEIYSTTMDTAARIADDIQTYTSNTAQKATADELKAITAEIKKRPEIHETVLNGNRHRCLSVAVSESITVKGMSPEILARLTAEYEKTGIWPMPHTIAVSRFRQIWPARTPSWARVTEKTSVKFVLDED